jgi:hypothetical protein
MLLLIAVVCGLAWLLGFGIYHVASAGIHLLLLIALVAGVVHIVRGATRHPHRIT